MSYSKRKLSTDEEVEANCYGPALPPHLRKKPESDKLEVSPKVIGPILPPQILKSTSNSTGQDSCTLEIETMEKSNVIGPVLPPHLVNDVTFKKTEVTLKSDSSAPLITSSFKREIGPILPPHLSNSKSHDTKEIDDTSPDSFGPALPPNLKNQNLEPQKFQRILGPSLPAHLINTVPNQENSDTEESDTEDTFGPLPPEARLNEAHIALEERALQMKMDQLEPNRDKAPEREEWMLELPEVKAAKFGLGPRQFRSKEGPDMSDRSSWTKVAGKSKNTEKETKLDIKKEAELRELQKRDKEQEKLAKKHKKKEKSLLESHQDKLKEKKKEEGPAERRPFSREIDLQVNRFDDAQKKAVLKKAELLDDRFSTGKSKFL